MPISKCICADIREKNRTSARNAIMQPLRAVNCQNIKDAVILNVREIKIDYNLDNYRLISDFSMIKWPLGPDCTVCLINTVSCRIAGSRDPDEVSDSFLHCLIENNLSNFMLKDQVCTMNVAVEIECQSQSVIFMCMQICHTVLKSRILIDFALKCVIQFSFIISITTKSFDNVGTVNAPIVADLVCPAQKH